MVFEIFFLKQRCDTTIFDLIIDGIQFNIGRYIKELKKLIHLMEGILILANKNSRSKIFASLSISDFYGFSSWYLNNKAMRHIYIFLNSFCTTKESSVDFGLIMHSQIGL